MKYIVLLGDGMADEPMEELGGKTVLEYANTPNMDKLAASSEVGLAHTVPEGFHPGSDVANLSVFGYDPATCYSGRSPLEAASMKVKLGPDDVAFRLNLVDIVHNYGKLYMFDFTAGHIGSAEARELIVALQDQLGGDGIEFYPGVSYRHLMVWRNGKDQMLCIPPHDIINQSIEDKLPTGVGADTLIQLTTSAQMILNNHPVNKARADAGKSLANSIWLWGQGKAPHIQTYKEKFGIDGTVVSAVDLIKGIGIYAGLDAVDVPGATGYVDTNYAGKVEAALTALQKKDFVYLHVEAPDEAGHSGDMAEKIQAIELFDEKIVGAMLDKLDGFGPYRMLIMPDHPTPLHSRTHSMDPVPYILYDSAGGFASSGTNAGYSEKSARAGGVVYHAAHKLIPRLLQQ
ncbi:MAG: cofactor-independent phosphoglycerate mutase [Desulfuromonadaceae bacterium]|nr:cofactor-independent phosphoglycerate mutase [Desulfuromonas sp.]MDY0185793.1 cofactor-independent phosphoglycerate mutase [Desulfuromonadaceae bacterium]